MRGRDKLLETIHGEALLARQARRALATGCPTLVCLRPGDRAREEALAGLGIEMLQIPDADEGMGATLRTAAKHVGNVPMMILLPDVPGVLEDDIRAVLDRFDALAGERVVRTTDPEGRPGTPLIIPARLLPAFRSLTDDEGGRSALHGEAIEKIALTDDRATRDLDTPEDWAAWRHRTRTPD